MESLDGEGYVRDAVRERKWGYVKYVPFARERWWCKVCGEAWRMMCAGCNAALCLGERSRDADGTPASPAHFDTTPGGTRGQAGQPDWGAGRASRGVRPPGTLGEATG